MAFVNTTQAITVADRFAALRADLNTALAKRKVFRTTVRELTALSDRELADLGVHRSNIKSIALDAVAKL